MAAFYVEEEVWKCPKHPSKRRRNGVCPVCLKDRLVILCPDCANVRPCACYASSTTASSSSSSSASSSFSLFSVRSTGAVVYGGACDGSVGKVSRLIDNEPAFRRSQSVGIPFLRSQNRIPGGERKSTKTASFWSIFKLSNSRKIGESEKDGLKSKANIYNLNDVSDDNRVEEFAKMMMRSRSMSVPITSGSGNDDVNKFAAGKSKGRWHFPSPMNVFRQSKASKLVHQRSPLYRG